MLPLVCRRWASLVHSRELLEELDITLSRAYVTPRFSTLCAFLRRCAGGSVGRLHLALGGGPPGDEGALEELLASLAACSAGGRLQQLSLQLVQRLGVISGDSPRVPLAGPLWAPACGPGLQELAIHGVSLRFDAPLASLTTLQRLSLTGLWDFCQNASLPGSLRELELGCSWHQRDLPTQVSCGWTACCRGGALIAALAAA